MNNLFLSFLIAIGGALGLVTLSRTFDLEFYTTRIFPLIPIIYAIVYEMLEKKKTGKDKTIPPAKAKEEMKAGVAKMFEHITVNRIFTAIGISFGIKLLFEVIFVALYIQFGNKTFDDLYGAFGIETIGKFLKGEHPWLEGSEGFYRLSLLAVITSFGTGLWIGYTSKGRAIFEGVLAGAAFTFVTAMTNMLILYRKIEEVANEMAASMGYGMHVGFAAVLTFQVLLFGFWAGIAQIAKERRTKLNAIRNSAKRVRK